MKYSVIIPTYNHCDDLLKPCIESILKHTKKDDNIDLSLIIVANGCTDNTFEYLEKLKTSQNIPFTIYSLWFDEPLGYTKAINQGILKSIELNSDYTILMNNDTAILDFGGDNVWLKMLTSPFDNDAMCGMTGPSKMIDETTQMPFIIFYLAMIKTSLFKTIGLLDEIFNPGFGEDIDFSIKLQKANYKLIRVPIDGVGTDYVETYPIYHAAEKTVHDEKSKIKELFGLSWYDVGEKNKNILRERYVINDEPVFIKNHVNEPINKKCSIIIPTTNDYSKKLDICLYTLFDATNITDDIEIIIVANGVTDATKQFLASFIKEKQANINVLYFDNQLGFPKAINAGISAATGDYVVLLNDDVSFLNQPKNEWIDILQDPFNIGQKVGITGVKKIGSSFSKQDYLMFFCVMISRELINKIGVLDENFSPAWVEDEEYCLRASLAGYQIIEIPADTPYDQRMVQIYHKSSATLSDFAEKRRIVKQNRYYLLNKYFPNDLVNVVVATYNRHVELRRALDSIEKQTYDKIKIWVCADGHDEEVQKIVEEFNEISEHKQYNYLHLPEHEGLLGSKPRMMGIDAIEPTGVACFLDDDNIMYPTYVEKLFNLMRSDGNYQEKEEYTPDSNIISYCVITHSHAPNPIPILGHVEGYFQYTNIDTLNVMINSYVAKQCKDKWQHVAGKKITHDVDFIQACSKYGKSRFLNEILAEHNMSLNKINGNNVEELPQPKITIAYIARNKKLFNQYLNPSLNALKNRNFDIMAQSADNLTPAQNYNKIISQSKNDHILFLHEDVIFSPNFLDQIYATIKQQPNFGVLGVEGGIHNEDLKETIKYEWAVENDIKKLTTIDSCCALINKKHNLLFDEIIFDDLHLYVEDYCMQANKELGLNNYTILTNSYPSTWSGYTDPNTFFIHKANTCNVEGYNWGNFNSNFKKLIDKWDKSLKRKSKVYDCFIFYNELDVLDIRFNELYDYVDKFVLVEATFTHQGNPKPLYFEENKQRYAKFLDKIIHIVVDKMCDENSSYIINQKEKKYFELGYWGFIRERYQRDAISRGLVDCKDDDIIMISDVDEIIDHNVIENYNISMGACALEMRLFYYKLNCESSEKWNGARIMPYSYIKDIYPSDLRYDIIDITTIISNAGWHFSYLYANANDIADKIKSFSVSELNTPEIIDISRIEYVMENAVDLFNRDYQFRFVELDSAFPKYILNNTSYFEEKKLINLNNKSKIYDCFQFHNELDILDIRFNELYDYVDKFVLVEATFTHQGNPKPLYFEENKQRYAKFLDKIEHIIVRDMPRLTDKYVKSQTHKKYFAEGNEHWIRERFQRDAIMQGLKNGNDKDIIIISDADEIVNHQVLENYNINMGFCALDQRLFYYKLNCEIMVVWPKARIMPYSFLKNIYPSDVRDELDLNTNLHISNGGWHFSYLYSTPEEISDKIQSFCHAELNTPENINVERIAQIIQKGEDLYGRNHPMKYVQIDNTYPKYVSDNYKKYILKNLIKALDIKSYDVDSYNEIFVVNLYEANKEDIENKTILDIGTNVGAFAVRCAELGAKKIICFEPEPNNFRYLQEFTEKYPNIENHQLAVLDGSKSFVHITNDGVRSTIWGEPTDVLVPSISFKKVIEEYASGNPDGMVLKLDCEGSEYEIILNTPKELIQKFETIFIEIHDRSNPNYMYKDKDLIKYIEELGYKDVTIRNIKTGFWTYDGHFTEYPSTVYKFKLIPINMSARPNAQILKDSGEMTFNEIYEIDTYGMNTSDLKNSVIIDIGAFHGIFSIRALELGAKVCYCFEPDKKNYSEMELLIKNIPEIKPYQIAILDGSVSEVRMFSENVTSNIRGNENGELVKCISLEEAISYAKIRETSDKWVLKVDCEGSEYEIILNTPKKVIQGFSTIYIEIHDKMNPNYQDKKQLLLDYLMSLGFSITHQGAQWGWWSNDGKTFEPAPVSTYRIQKNEYLQNKNKIKPKVYDCFMFNDELDVLDIRLAELDSVVDYFVIVEATHTHSGKPKSLYFDENKKRYAKYSHKIRHYILDDLLTLPDDPNIDPNWHRESFQRESCMKGLYDADLYDIVISGDADEIPKKEIIKSYDVMRGVVGVETKYYFYYLNCERQDKGTTHMRIIPYHIIRTHGFCYYRYKDYPIIPNGGWHFSFIGDVKQIQKKFDSYAHQEYNTDYYTNTERLTKMINEGSDILEKGMTFNFVKIDDTFPKYLINNQFKYKHVIKEILNNIEKNALNEIDEFTLTQPSFFKLNLGCGDEILDGYVNCDIANPKADMQLDAAVLPFEDNSIDEIRAYHLIEHFPFQKGLIVLKEWLRVLKPNGVVVIETPDFLNSCKKYVEASYPERLDMHGHFFSQPDISLSMAHFFLFTEKQLEWSLELVGFINPTRVPADSHHVQEYPDRQDLYLKMIAHKPNN